MKKTRLMAAMVSTALILTSSGLVYAEEEREPITFTWGVVSTDVGTQMGILTDQYPFLKKIKEKFNVEIEWVEMTEEKFTMMAASGDLPDFCTNFGSEDMPVLIENDQVLELTDLLNEYGPDTLKMTGDIVLDELRNTYGGVYMLPVNVISDVVPSDSHAWTFSIRMDLYQKMGAPEMKNEEDLIEVLKQMQDMQREAAGDDSIYALTIPGTDVLNLVCPGRVYGYEGDSVGVNFRFNEPEDYVLAYTNPEAPFWKYYEFCNKAWKAGIIDPESFTQDMASVQAKIQNGKALGSPTASCYQPDPAVCGEDAVMAFPIGAFEYIPSIYGTFACLGSYPQQSYFLPSTCRYPERIMEVFNWMNTAEGARILANGEQGVHWDYNEEGIPVYIGETAKAVEETGTYTSIIGKAIFNRAIMFNSSCANLYEDGYCAAIYNTQEYKENLTSPRIAGFLEKYYGDYGYLGELYAELVNEGVHKTATNGSTRLMAGLMELPSDEAKLAIDYCYNGMMERYANIVTADDFEAAQQEVFEEFRANGMTEEVEEELLSKAAKASERVAALLAAE